MRQLTLVEWVVKYTGTRYHEIYQIAQKAREPDRAEFSEFRRQKQPSVDVEFIGDVDGILSNVTMTVTLNPGSVAYTEFMAVLYIRKSSV